VTLTIKERLLLLASLPREGNITTLRIVHDLRAALSFSEEEHAALKMEQDAEGFRWDSTVSQDTEVEVGPRAYVIVQDTLKGMDKSNKLTEDFFSLWDKFCEERCKLLEVD
jgi:hypothetical protein